MRSLKVSDRKNNRDFMSIYGAYTQNTKKRAIFKNNGKAIISKDQSHTISQNMRKSLIDLPNIKPNPNKNNQKYEPQYSKRNVHEISDLIISTK